MATLIFNSYNLQTSNIITEKVLHTSAPENDLITESKARRDGSFLMSNYWRKKTIFVTGHIIGTSISNLESRIDTLKQNLVGQKKSLDVGYAGGTRRYTATVKSITIEREHFNSYWCPFSIEFECANPFGEAISSTTETLLAQTSSPFSKVITMIGSIGAYPVITIDLTSGDNVTAIEIKNTTLGDFITIARSFSDAESLVVDCENLTVQVDSTEVDFTGVFPAFEIGTNTVDITVTGTPFNVDLTLVYTASYI